MLMHKRNGKYNPLSVSTCFILWALLSSLINGCGNPTDFDTPKLNVDRNIPASEAFNASYGFWGPEGSTIYFQHDKNLGSNPNPGLFDQLWKLDLKTGKRQIIHRGRIIFADISPDGQWFVFNSFGTPQYLYKMRNDGTDLQQLTGPWTPNPDFGYTIQGEWSPDGSSILFSLSAGVPRGVSVMKSSGANSQIIVPFGIAPNWSQGGDQITYVNYDTTKADNDQAQVYIANADGSNPEQLTSLQKTTFNIQEPSLSPNKEKIVFAYDDELYLMKANGEDVEQITAGGGFAARPEWSPDGETILFTRIIYNGPERLYYLDVATREVTPVFPQPP